jgi:hypothetical protein
MKAQKNFLLCLSMVLLLQAQGQQGRFKLDVDYSVGIPTGNLKNLVSETSWRGWSGAIMYGLTDQIELGFGSGFQDFYQKYPRQVLHESGSDVSAVITNSIQTIPILLKGKYKIISTGMVQPFVGLGVGANLIQYQKYYGQFVDSYSRFGFAAQPEAGIHVPIGKLGNAGVHLAAGYNYMPYKQSDADGLHHVVIKAGTSIPLR